MVKIFLVFVVGGLFADAAVSCTVTASGVEAALPTIGAKVT
jgi:hypothetical protein